MKLEKDIFEKEGLKIDKERILTYSQLSCPFGCRYCFVEDMNFNQQKNVPYLSERQFRLLEKLPDGVNAIMLGCDTELFQSKEDSLETLERISSLGKDISVITKMFLRDDFIKKLKSIDLKLKEKNNIFVLSVSIPCFDSAKEWEPGVTSPKLRMETLVSAYEARIKTMVAIRPLIPMISNQELEKIIDLTKDYCEGYYSGPLYLKDLERSNIIQKESLRGLKIEKLQPHWMPEGNIFYKIEKEGQMDFLESTLKKQNKPLFEGAAEGIKYLKNHEKH